MASTVEVEEITRHQSIRGRGGVIAVMYKTQWTGLSGPSWEPEMDLQLFRHEILRYWAGTPNQHRQTNRLHRRTRISAAQREISRNNGERFLAHGYGCVPRAEWLSRYSTTVPPNGADLVQGRRRFMMAWEYQRERDHEGGICGAFLDDPWLINLLTPACSTTSTGAVRGSWRLQLHLASSFARRT